MKTETKVGPWVVCWNGEAVDTFDSADTAERSMRNREDKTPAIAFSANALPDLIAVCETAVAGIDEGQSAKSIAQYINVSLRAALKEMAVTRAE